MMLPRIVVVKVFNSRKKTTHNLFQKQRKTHISANRETSNVVT